MTQEDIDRVKLQYVDAAKAAREAGFDAIEIHGANGSVILCVQFLRVVRPTLFPMLMDICGRFWVFIGISPTSFCTVTSTHAPMRMVDHLRTAVVSSSNSPPTSGARSALTELLSVSRSYIFLPFLYTIR